jgi:hypothetical protein
MLRILMACVFVSSCLWSQSGSSTPVLETTLNSPASDTGGSLSLDGLTLHFASMRSGSWQIWSATRATPYSPWGAPTEETALAASGVNEGPFLSASGLEIIFGTSAPGGSGGTDIVRATCATTASGQQEILSSRFDGLTKSGTASLFSTASLHYRDSAAPGATYAMAASLGSTGFAHGPFFIPLDIDLLFLLTLATDIPPFTSGFVGVLDANGEATATATNATGVLSGAVIQIAAVTIDPSSNWGLSRVSNPITLLFA